MVNADHQVFQQIQTAQTDSPFGTGLILFANDFTGSPVEMNEKVREALTSEELFIGNNPIIQLKKALERLEGGPWYVDCRGDMLYIHNRSFNTNAVHNYTYDHGNGEVLSVSFKTQYRTKNAPRAATLSFDSFKKTLNISSTGTSIGSDQEIAAEAAKIKAEENMPQLKAIPNVDYLSKDISNPSFWENKQMFAGQTPQTVQAETDTEFSRMQKEDYETLKGNLQDYGTYSNLVQSYLNGRGMVQGSMSGQYLDQQLQALKDDPEKLDAFLQEQFGGDNFTVVNDLYRPFVETLSLTDLVPSTCYIPVYNTSHQAMNTSYVYKNGYATPVNGGDFAYSIYRYLKEKGYVVVGASSGITYNRRQYTDHSIFDNVKVTRVVKKKGDYRISGYRLMSDFVSRKLNSPEGQYQRYLLNHAMNNSTRKITEARLEIEMRVIGRPSLTSSSKIHIENVGSRSGDYIIKTCIHRFSNEGYTCSLTLLRGSYKTAANSDTVSINFGKSKGSDTNSSPTKDRANPDTDFKVIPTQEELEYFAQFSGNVSKQAEIATEITWYRYQAWKNGNLSSAQNRGVYHKHVDMDSSGNVTKTTWTQTPAPKVENYEEFKTVYSRKYYDDIKRKAADFQRYHK